MLNSLLQYDVIKLILARISRAWYRFLEWIANQISFLRFSNRGDEDLTDDSIT